MPQISCVEPLRVEARYRELKTKLVHRFLAVKTQDRKFWSAAAEEYTRRYARLNARAAREVERHH